MIGMRVIGIAIYWLLLTAQASHNQYRLYAHKANYIGAALSRLRRIASPDRTQCPISSL